MWLGCLNRSCPRRGRSLPTRTAFSMRSGSADSFLFLTTSSSPRSFPVSTAGIFPAIPGFLRFQGSQAIGLLFLTYISLKGLLDCLQLELSSRCCFLWFSLSFQCFGKTSRSMASEDLFLILKCDNFFLISHLTCCSDL